MRRKLAFLSLGITALLVVAGVVLAVAYVADRRLLAQPLEITKVEVVSRAGVPSALMVSGAQLAPPLQAILLPNPTFDEGDPRALAPHTALFQVDSDGEIAVASARGRRIVAVDIRQGHPLQILGSLELDRRNMRTTGITALLKVGTRVVASLSSDGGLALIDLTDPAAPRKLDHLYSPVDFTDMLAVNGRIIAAGVRSGLWQVHSENDRLRIERLPGPRRAWRLASDGSRVVSASLEGELAFFELDGSATFRLVGLERISGEIRGVTLAGNALHLCLADGTLREYDVARWPHIVERGEVRLPGRALRMVRSKETHHLVCTLVGVGAALVDISQPGHPAIAGWLPTNVAISDLSFAGGRILYVNSNGLKVRNIANLLKQQQLSVSFPLDQRRKRVRILAWQGQALAYDPEQVTSFGPGIEEGTMQSAPAGPLLALPGNRAVRLYGRQGDGFVELSRLPVAGTVKAARFYGDYLHVLTEEALAVYSCNVAGEATLLGRFEGFEYAEAFAWAEPEYLLVVDRNAGLMVLSVRDPAVPRLVAKSPIPAFIKNSGGGAYDVVVRGQRAFVARGVFGVEIYNLADVRQPRIQQLLDTPGNVRSLAMHGELLLASDRGRGLQVIDTRGETCRLIGNIVAAAQVDNMVVSVGKLLTGTSLGAISQIPLPLLLRELQPTGGGVMRIPLPEGLARGIYQLVLYNDQHVARADISLN